MLNNNKESESESKSESEFWYIWQRTGPVLRWPAPSQKVTAPPSGHFHTLPCPSRHLCFILCVTVPVGSSAMLNAPLSSFPRQELICEIIYCAVYFRAVGGYIINLHHTYLNRLGTGCWSNHIHRSGFNMLISIWLNLNLTDAVLDAHLLSCTFAWKIEKH